MSGHPTPQKISRSGIANAPEDPAKRDCELAEATAPRPAAALPARSAAEPRLLALLRERRIPFGLERSFRIDPGGISTERVLLSCSRGTLRDEAVAVVASWAHALGMPAAELARLIPCIAQARFFHLGAERSSGGQLFKLYCELPWETLRPEPDPHDGAPAYLLHAAVKWCPDVPGECHWTRYRCFPSLGLAQIEARLGRLLGAEHPLLPALREVFAAVDRSMGLGGTRYLEVDEGSNPRRSFTLNLYEVGRRVADLLELGRLACRAFGPDPTRLDALGAAIGELSLGNLASGLHRDGRPFLTIYYGAEEHGGPPV